MIEGMVHSRVHRQNTTYHICQQCNTTIIMKLGKLRKKHYHLKSKGKKKSPIIIVTI